LAPVFAATGAVFDAGATFFFAIFDMVITSFSVFFVHCGFSHEFMFFLYRDIRFVPGPEFKRIKKGYFFMDRERETRREI
jgi:hypothetical protein